MASMKLCIVLLIGVGNVIALNTIDCAKDDVCVSSDVVTCDQHDDCQILCNEPSICNHKIFICPTEPNRKCYIECVGSSCLHTTFDAANSVNGSLSLQISGNFPNDLVWSFGSLQCPPAGDCAVTAMDDNMQHNDINALKSKSLNITIFSQESDSNILANTDIYCPIYENSYCNVDIFEGIVSNANVYSMDTSLLSIACHPNENCFDSTKQAMLYCGIQYTSECPLISDGSLDHCICGNIQKASAVTLSPITNTNQNAVGSEQEIYDYSNLRC